MHVLVCLLTKYPINHFTGVTETVKKQQPISRSLTESTEGVVSVCCREEGAEPKDSDLDLPVSTLKLSPTVVRFGS